jgi:demethylmenaquinone methyltransferase/2-methoxy-6-polyprenyl-1,4-benzoquinol methylase
MTRRTDPATGGARLAGRERETYVGGMFDRIAAPYDRLNRVISLGRDRAWRERLVAEAGCRPGSCVADLGSGTGDLALAFAAVPGVQVVGLDLSAKMLERAMAKVRERSVPLAGFVRGNARQIPLPDAWAQVVSMGWCLRNVGDRPDVYREVLRVLEPGGVFLNIDMSRPRRRIPRAGFFLYRHLVMPLLARLGGAEAGAYRYLATSTDRFPDGPALEQELRAAGFTDVSHRPLMTGAVAIHRARRPGQPAWTPAQPGAGLA